MSSLNSVVALVNEVLNVNVIADKTAHLPNAKYDNNELVKMATSLIESGKAFKQSETSFQDGIVFLRTNEDVCFSIDRNGRIWA